MKKILTVLVTLSLAAAGSAQVIPGQAGIYTGTYKTKTMTTDSSLKDSYKTRVICTIAADGSALITSPDGMAISGRLVAGPKLGFFSVADEFITGTGVWQMKKKGNIKASMQYGVRPGGNVVFIVNGNLKLKQIAPTY